MKYIILLILLSAGLLLGFNSCYYDKASQLYPTNGCDTTNVTYSLTIRNIIQGSGCLACHTAPASSGGNIILDNYNDVKTVALSGRLYGAINQSPGFSAMPKSGGKLTNCDISKVKKWIDLGILNN